MKKVIPKKKDAFRVLDNSKVSKPISFQSSSFQFPIIIEESLGIAGKNIHTGDLLMVRKKDGLIVPFTGPEGRSNV